METELKITEDWIKDRINLKGDKLEDVKTLSLPGTYQEKITNLGSSLQHFTRLKELDLSRNAIESLDGLQHLLCLEDLNVYYNSIGTLKEIYKLRSNSKLKSIDLRLNPVARNEPDYRLFVIHMLPSLQKLDDRAIRDQERKAALMHFGTDQASEFNSPRSAVPKPSSTADGGGSYESGSDLRESTGSRHPRAQQVDRMKPNSLGYPGAGIPPLSGLGDDVMPLEEANHKGGGGEIGGRAQRWGNEEEMESGPMAPRGHSASRRRDGESSRAVEYSHRERLQVERRMDNDSNRNATNSVDVNMGAQGYTDTTGYNQRSPTHYPDSLAAQQTGPSRGSYGPASSQRFTPNPSAALDHSDYNVEEAGNNAGAGGSLGKSLASQTVIGKFCDLVDRYWNGSKSLHAHPRFQPAAQAVLAEVMSPNLNSDNSSALRSRVRQLEQQLAVGGEGSTDSQLREKLRRVNDENRELQRQIEELEKSGHRNGSTSSGGGDISRETESLRMEVSTLRVKLKSFEQMSDLANMLKESHKSLVATNDHLMRELAENRERHQQEVSQLRWSYDQMKRTYEKAPAEYQTVPRGSNNGMM